MNAGLSSLTKLKSFLLPPSMRARTDFDDQLVSLGIGVALMMERFCDRRFTRTVNDTFKASANNVVVSLPRFPLEALAAVTLLGSGSSGSTTTITDSVLRTDLNAGLVHFSTPPGAQQDTLTLTYTGGFWWDTSEDDSGELPAGANALPADLLLAWHLQMKAVCEAQNILGTSAAGDAKAKAASLDLDFVPAAKSILNAHRRFA